MDPVQFRMVSTDELELAISGVIGDGWDECAATAKAVRKALSGTHKTVKRIGVELDSSGGSFFDGLAIYQMLVEHPAQVHVTIGARAASAASLIAMSGDTIEMHESSSLLIHPVWTYAVGNAEELRKTADDLDVLTEASVKAYAARSGMSEQEVRDLMAEDRYMPASEALKLGLCTGIKKSKKKPAQMDEREVRSEIEAMRNRATASARALHMAAMATKEPTDSTPALPAETEKNKMGQLAVILAALCLSEGASEADVLSACNGLKAKADKGDELLAALGAKSSDEGLGIIAGLKGAGERAARAEAELAQVRQAELQSKKDALINGAINPKSGSQHAGKLSPAQKAWAESVSLETLEGFLAVAPAVVQADAGRFEPLRLSPASANANQSSDPAPTWNGKTYAELTNAQRVSLANENADLFSQMREHALRNRLI